MSRSAIFTLLICFSITLQANSCIRRHKSDHYNHDIETQSELTDLYNLRVVWAKEVTRPMKYVPEGIVQHHGMQVGAEDESEWLIHEGKGYGNTGGDNVVVDAKHMDPNTWQEVKGTSREVTKDVTIGDLVAGYQGDYNLLFHNCIGAANNMKEKLWDE